MLTTSLRREHATLYDFWSTQQLIHLTRSVAYGHQTAQTLISPTTEYGCHPAAKLLVVGIHSVDEVKQRLLNVSRGIDHSVIDLQLMRDAGIFEYLCKQIMNT